MLHGEAIAVGMILESYISWQKKLLSAVEYLEIKNTINTVFETIVFEENDLQPILDLLIHDKKNEYGKVQFALLDGIGNIKINQFIFNFLINFDIPNSVKQGKLYFSVFIFFIVNK